MLTATNFSNSEILRARISAVLPGLLRISGRLNRHPAFALNYTEYLFILHCMIRASVPLMSFASQLCSERHSDEAESAKLVEYFEKHCKEEAGHDDWLLEDLESIGVSGSDVWARIPPKEVAEMVGAQYYWMLHHRPVALLGYIAVMEGNPPTPSAIDEIRQRTRIPKSAFRTMYKHADIDPGHKAELDILLDSLLLAPDELKLICVSAMTTVACAAKCFSSLLERCDVQLSDK
jgi:hypothetical protein